MRLKYTLILSGSLIVAAASASAQAPPAPSTPPKQTAPPAPSRANVDCSPMQQAPRKGTAAPDGNTTGQRAEPLGDKLARSDGVLCPPAGVDPEIRAPTPDSGNTPVIPPPGSPGGDPNVRQK
jgi:hypothetical protein